jgi:hypothetical protein
MNVLVWVHIAAGSLALLAGAVAISARKGGRLHARSGTGFVAAMLLLWVTATVLHLLERKAGAAVGDIFIGYFVATSWAAARRSDGGIVWFEMIACAVVLGTGVLIAWGALSGRAAPTPVGLAPYSP